MRRSIRPKKPSERGDFVYEEVFINEICKRSKSARLKDSFYYPATRILQHKVAHGELLFLIEWADGTPSTWEPDVSPPALAEYLEALLATVAFLPEGLTHLFPSSHHRIPRCAFGHLPTAGPYI